jgi:hypothetical protein
MKKISLAIALCTFVARFSFAQDPSFPGLEKVMDAETYSRAGVENLSDEQRAVLDAFLRNYIAGKEKDAGAVAAAQAVDRAVKERKVRPPEVVESSMVGDYKSSGLRARFRLANGQVWRPTDDEVLPQSSIANPKVVIYKDFFGYKMFVEGAGFVRVKRVN